MVLRKLLNVMARSADQPRLVDVEIVLAGEKAVVLGRAVGMALRALRVHIDRAARPRRCRLSAVTAHIGACPVKIVLRCSAFCAVFVQDLDVNHAVIMIDRSRARTGVAGFAYSGNPGQERMSGMGSADVGCRGP